MALPRTLDQIRSQNPQLDQLDDHTIMVAIYNRDFADKMTPQQYMEATGYKPSASTMDYVKSAAAGAGDLVAAAGYGVEKLGADRVGGAIRDAGQTAQRYWVDDMTGAGRSVANNPIVTDDYALGDTPLQSTQMAASRSVPGMLATAPVGGVVGLAAKSGLGRLAVAKGAQAAAEAGTTTLAQKALLAAPGAIGMGVAEGGQAALVNAEQTHAKVMDLAATPEDVLLQNPTYRATLQQTRDPLAARKAVADETANQVLRNTMVSTGGIGILTGGGALGSVFNRVTGQAGTSLAGAGLGGMAKAMAKDIGKEAGQEFLQSGAEQYIQNAAERDHLDPSKDAWRGVGPAALSGAAVGGLLGGGTHVLGKPFEARRATAPTEPPVTDTANLPAIYRPGGEYIPANEPAPSQQQPEAPPAAKYNVTPDGVAIPVAPEVRALPDKSGTLYANQYGVASDQLADVAPNEQMAKELDAQTRRRDGALRVIGKIQQRASELDGEALAQFQANSAPALARAQQAWQESDAVIAELRHGNDADKQESAAEPVRAATVAEQPGPTPSIERSVPEVQEQAPEAATPPSPKGKSSSRTKADKQDQQTAMLSDEALSERESYIADQAKRNGGWNTMLAAGMREVRNEQTKRAKAARHDDLFKAEDKVANDVPQQVEQAKPVEKPVKWFTTAERATTYIDKKKLTDTHEAVAVERLAPNGKHVTVHEIHPKSVKSVKKGAEPVPAKKDAAEASALEVVEPKQATNADTPPSPAIPSKVESQEEESHSSKSDDDAPSAQVAEQIPLRSTPPETPSQTEKKKAARKATAPTTAKPHLEDVGDALRWNRKGIFRNGGLTWDAIKDENDTLKVKLASKEKIWARPNWEAIIEAVPEDQREGFTVIAHLVKQVYDALPKQSTNVSDKALQTYIDVVGELRESANTLLNNKERQGALWVELGKRAQKVGLLSHSDYFDYLIPAKRDASIMPLFAELFPKQAAGERFSRGTPENDRAMALGRKAVSAMQWNTSSAKDALLAIKDGWPAKQAAWQKQGYRIISAGDITSEIHQLRSGRHAAYLPLDATTNEYVGSFETEKTAQAAADELLAKRANRFLLLNKRKTVLGDYASEAEALNAAKSQTARKTETEPDKDVAPNDGGWERKGVDRRNPGENITPERLEQTFNFRGVNFGNWVSQEERQQHVNAAFDALHDLATAMGIPPAAMGLGGKLGLAFGAQGNGGRNAAHFVPGVNEINITRTSGAGALAHEWGHALDHHFGVLAGLSRDSEPFASWLSSYRRAKPDNKIRPEVAEAFQLITQTMQSREESAAEGMARAEHRLAHTQQKLADILKQEDLVNRLAGNDTALVALEKIKAGDIGEYVALSPEKGRRKSPGAIGGHIKTVADALGYNNGQSLDLAQYVNGVHFAMQAMADKSLIRRIHTHFYKLSRTKDGDKGGKAYWSTPHEMFARAFETWVMDKLANNEASNHYLVSNNKRDKGDTDPDYPYPAGEERKVFNQAFERLISELKVQESEGGPLLYSRSDDHKAGDSGSDAALLRKQFGPLIARWRNAPQINIVQSVTDLPVHYLDKLHSQNADGDVEGFFDQKANAVYLVADRLTDNRRALHVLVHEVLGHAGPRGLFGKQLNPLLASIYRGHANVREAADNLMQRYGYSQLLAVEEVLADMALKASLTKQAFWPRVVTIIRNLLRRYGLLRQWTDNDIVSMLGSARRYVMDSPASKGANSTDSNHVATSRQDGPTQRMAKAWKLLAQADELFRYPRPEGFTLADIAAEIDPALAVVVDNKTYSKAEREEQKIAQVWKMTMADRREAWIIENRTGEVWIDASSLAKGVSAGSKLYAAVASYAAANGKVFIGDPAGLSEAALVRRTEQMLSSALKEGMTQHLMPHARQMDPDGYQPNAKINAAIRPITWVTGDDAHNLLELLKTSYHNVRQLVPDVAKELNHVSFNFTQGRFERDGPPVDDEYFNDLAADSARELRRNGFAELITRSTGDSGRTQDRSVIGSATLKRTVITRTLLREAGSTGWGSILARLGEHLPGNRLEKPLRRLLYSRAGQREITDALAKAFQSDRTFNRWWHRSVGTQYHKATISPAFKRVFDAGQSYLHDVSRLSMRAEAAAPSLLPKVGDLRELIQNGKNAFSKARRQAVKVASQAVFAGTLQYTRDKDGNLHQIEGGVAGGVVFSDDELRKLFKLDQQAIDIYRESRAAIDTSLDDVTRSTLFKLLRKSALNPLLVENLRETSASLTSLKQTIGAALTRVAQDQERSGNTSQAARILKLAKLADDVIDKAESLKARGYAPLMRFGNYAVDVTDSKGDRIAFQLFESQLEANRAAFKLAKAYPQAKVRQSILSESGYKLFKGMTPETVALFAKELGVDKDEATQEYLQLAVSNRSALKRMIHRKGVEGYCDDLSRVVASFIVSNARQASGNFNRVEMLEAAEACKGDVKDEAVSLVQYLTEPKEEAAVLRGYMFLHFLGGSVASAAVNLTQPAIMTFPYLSQFGGPAKAAKRLSSAASRIYAKRHAPDLAKALKQAEADGIVAPHEIHQLMAEAGGTMLDRQPGLRAFKAIWGSMFALAESVNRRMTFIAAFETATEEKIKDPYQFAERAVQETQGLYNRGNRPNWARGVIGATVFTFKQYSISYLEMFKRMDRQGQAIALAVLLLAAGLEGLPFAEDIQDLIDTLGRFMGYNTDSETTLRRAVIGTFGKAIGGIALDGASALPGMPLDVQGRLGLGNLLPGTRLLTPFENNKTDDIAQFAGPVGGLLGQAGKAFGNLASGDVKAAFGAIAPVAIQNIAKGADMAMTGMYRDTKGRKVIDTSITQALIKGIGFQPREVAETQQDMGQEMRRIELHRSVKQSIADQLAQAIALGDNEGRAEALRRLKAWNAKNPGTPLQITRTAIGRRVKEIRMSKQERIAKRIPRELRGG